MGWRGDSDGAVELWLLELTEGRKLSKVTVLLGYHFFFLLYINQQYSSGGQ